jgi:hypothetical protein
VYPANPVYPLSPPKLDADAKIIRYPDVYHDEDGEQMWERLMGFLDDLERSPSLSAGGDGRGEVQRSRREMWEQAQAKPLQRPTRAFPWNVRQVGVAGGGFPRGVHPCEVPVPFLRDPGRSARGTA